MSHAERKRPTDAFNDEFKRSSGVIRTALGKPKGKMSIKTLTNPAGALIRYDPEKYTVDISKAGEVLIAPKATK